MQTFIVLNFRRMKDSKALKPFCIQCRSLLTSSTYTATQQSTVSQYFSGVVFCLTSFVIHSYLKGHRVCNKAGDIWQQNLNYPTPVSLALSKCVSFLPTLGKSYKLLLNIYFQLSKLLIIQSNCMSPSQDPDNQGSTGYLREINTHNKNCNRTFVVLNLFTVFPALCSGSSYNGSLYKNILIHK